MSSFTPPGDCPVCGASVSAGVSSCDECGSCPETGWSEDAAYDGLDLPETESAASPSKAEKPLMPRLLLAVFLLALAFGMFWLSKP